MTLKILIKKIKGAIKHPEKLIVLIGRKTAIVPDVLYLKALYRYSLGKKLNLKQPVGFNEKIQWLKLNYRREEQTTMVDKAAVKKYVAEIIGEDYIIPTYGVWKHFNEIPFDELPQRFVLKCTHDSAGVLIVKDKESLDKEKAEKKFEACLKRNYYLSGREWPYKNVPPRIMAEEYKEDSETKELRDYKFYTFNGKPQLMMIVKGRGNHSTEANYYDMNFKHLDFTWGYPPIKEEIDPPVNFEMMKYFASLLARDTVHLRVDFYEVDGALYFGELTFFDGSGLEKFSPEEWDQKLGDKIHLPLK